MRQEHDFIGVKTIPPDAYRGVHTARAVENFAVTGHTVAQMPALVRAFAHANLIAATSDTGAFVDISGVLKRIAAKPSKTGNDLRLLSSGPQAGVGDIRLPARQAGSSIMPGKANPVIPEAMNQVCFEVIGNAAITMACEAGQLQLNAFEPLIAWALHKIFLCNFCAYFTRSLSTTMSST